MPDQTSAAFEEIDQGRDKQVSFNFESPMQSSEQSLFPPEWDATSPNYGGLYSTPLSWDPPEPRLSKAPDDEYKPAIADQVDDMFKFQDASADGTMDGTVPVFDFNDISANGLARVNTFDASNSDSSSSSHPQTQAPPQQPQQQPQQQQPNYGAHPSMNTLTSAQRDKLRSIAMPQHLKFKGNKSTHHQGPTPPSDAQKKEASASSSPEAAEHEGKKRKSSTDPEDEDEDEDCDHPPVKKTAHNMIEKRYRTNLNDKIAALRDSVPSLRVMAKSARGEDADAKEDLQGLTPAHKLNKATILSKATEYIRHLEKRNSRLTDEVTAMKARINAFEKLFISGAMGGIQSPPIPQPYYGQEMYMNSPNSAPNTTPGGEPQGMIQVPEDIRRLHQSQLNQQIYPVPQENYQPNVGRAPGGQHAWVNGGSYFGKLMVGSLAGLMIMEGFSEAEPEGDGPNARGLSALPVQMLAAAGRHLRRMTDVHVLGYHSDAAQTISYLRFALMLGALLYVFLPQLFKPKSQPRDGKLQSTSPKAAPSPAAPIQVRRQAWLTSIQTVWVPRHNFFLEAAALILKMLKLSVRNIIGWNGYSFLTGITEQQEAARIKAWEVALDAQLAGGDVEVSKSRLILTLMASGTLPDTPARLMLKAVHIRVLLWEFGNSGFNSIFMFREIAAKIARWKWSEAQQLQKIMTSPSPVHDPSSGLVLPDHLIALLEQECDDVLVDPIGQRAYNLAWNLPTTDKSEISSPAMDLVVEDSAIRSPLDAVAAWFSILTLTQALKTSILADDDEANESIAKDIDLAVRTAPVGSNAQVVALVARAVLIQKRRGESLAAALHAMTPMEAEPTNSEGVPSLINTTAPTSIPSDVRTSLDCANAIAHLEHTPAPADPTAAYPLIDRIIPVKLTLLGFVAAFKLMETIAEHERAASKCSRRLESLAGNLRIWVGGIEGLQSGLDKETRETAVERCLLVAKKAIGIDKDAGYESMSEHDDIGAAC